MTFLVLYLSVWLSTRSKYILVWSYTMKPLFIWELVENDVVRRKTWVNILVRINRQALPLWCTVVQMEGLVKSILVKKNWKPQHTGQNHILWSSINAKFCIAACSLTPEKAVWLTVLCFYFIFYLGSGKSKSSLDVTLTAKSLWIIYIY